MFKSGTKIYADESIKFRPRYIDIIKKYYHAEVESIDFKQEKAVAQRINSWVDNVTNHNILDFVSEGK